MDGGDSGDRDGNRGPTGTAWWCDWSGGGGGGLGVAVVAVTVAVVLESAAVTAVATLTRGPMITGSVVSV